MASGKEQKNKPPREKRSENRPKPAGFRLKFPFIWLSVAVLVVYVPTLKLGFTELDDSIFIREMESYNKDPANLITSFKRGVFNETEDIYYRPLLLDSFILNYQLNGINIRGYHVINILLHLISVLLLFALFRKIGIKELHAVLLTLIFAAHPVLTQAVAWIPGRNDTLLAVFVFLFLITAVGYSRDGKISSLLVSLLCLLAAFFTKETAIFAPPVAVVVLILILKGKLFERRHIILYASWLIVFLFWYAIRSQATLKEEQVRIGEIFSTLGLRLPVLIQYLGKIVLPFNLSVFPIMKDTAYVYGIVSVLLLGAGVYFNRERDWKTIIAGIMTYVLFLIPVLLVPSSLNDQDFEHRLYLPILGILLVVSETVLFKNRLKELSLFIGGMVLIIVLSIMNLSRQKFFNDPLIFWKEAVRTSPHSAYANMMLGARMDKEDKQRASEYIKLAYQLNPDEKYVNYYMGKLLLDKDSVGVAEAYFLKEIKKSDYYECYFHLARVAFEKNEFDKSVEYLNQFLSRSPGDPQGNNNLLLLYMQTNQIDKAREQMKKMQELGLEIPQEAVQQLK